MTSVFELLALLYIKHWYIDFVNQSMEEVNGKGIYGNWMGLRHSVKHGLATIAVMLVGGVSWPSAIVLGIVDFVTHYHIDWCKMNYGNRDITTPAFWNHLGLDQMAHNFVYLFIVWTLV